LYEAVQGRSYGATYESTLRNRSLKSALYDEDAGSLVIEWDGTAATELGLNLDYTDIQGNIRKVLVAESETVTTLPDFKSGEPVFIAAMHKPNPTAIDTFLVAKGNVPYLGKITDQKLKNTKVPFERGDFVFGRFYLAADWIANEAAATNGNVDTAPVFNDGLALHAWWLGDGWPSQYFENGKLYQTTELEAGTYRFEVTTIEYTLPNKKVFVAAALGNDLPDVDELPDQALDFYGIPGNGKCFVTFNLNGNSTVSLGFSATMGTREHIVFSKVDLYMLEQF
jgi:hypothetical protein